MKDTVLLENGKSRLLRSVSNFLQLYPTYESMVAALVAGTLPVDFAGVNSAGCAQIGTSLNKANLLSDATAQALGLISQDPTINEALAALSGKADPAENASVSLSTTWTGTGPYTQTVTLSGYTPTANTKVDLQPDATAIAQMISDGVLALYIVNNNGTLTAYAVGAAPTAALTIQVTCTEVAS